MSGPLDYRGVNVPEVLELLKAIESSKLSDREYTARAGVGQATIHYMRTGRCPNLTTFIALWGVLGKKIVVVEI